MMSNRISGILLITLAALCVTIVIEARSGVPSVENLRASADKGEGTSVTGPVRLTLPPLAALSETVARPLFTETRRPPEMESNGVPDTPGPVAAASAAGFTVSAIIITESERAVLVVHPQSGELTRVAEGETIAGWRLDRVENDQAVFSKDGDTREAALRIFGPPPPHRPPRSARALPRINTPERAPRRTLGGTRLRPFGSQEESTPER